MDPPKISDDLCPFLLYLCLFYACTNTLVLAVELVPVMESLGTEELLGGHPVTIKLDQQREPVLRPTQVRWISYFLLLVLFASKVGCPLFPEIFISGWLWEIPDSNPGPYRLAHSKSGISIDTVGVLFIARFSERYDVFDALYLFIRMI